MIDGWTVRVKVRWDVSTGGRPGYRGCYLVVPRTGCCPQPAKQQTRMTMGDQHFALHGSVLLCALAVAACNELQPPPDAAYAAATDVALPLCLLITRSLVVEAKSDP
jgi:hypothetical protein